MPIEVRGFNQLRRALGNFEPNLKHELETEIRAFAKPVISEAKAYVPMAIAGLSQWQVSGSAAKFKRGDGKKGFPKFNSAAAKQGIRLSSKATKRNNSGFISLYRIVNSNAGGVIYETTGRGTSHRASRSNNPDARQHFMDSMGGLPKGNGKMRGRVIFRAWDENQGKAMGGIAKAVDNTLVKFQKGLAK